MLWLLYTFRINFCVCEKVKRLETLLTKCKDTIKSNKERIQQLATDRDAMAKQAQEKMDELEKFKVCYSAI